MTVAEIALVEACNNAVSRKDGWLNGLSAALSISERSDWHDLYERASELAQQPDDDTALERLNGAVIYFDRNKCCQCAEFGEARNSCGHYAGRYCDSHWATSGYRDAGDTIDFLDAGEYETEEEAY